MVIERCHYAVPEPSRSQRLGLCFNPSDYFQRFWRLIEPQGHDLIGIMNEVQDNLAIDCQKRSDLGLLVIAAGVLLEQSLVEQVVDEDVAVFVGDEEVLAKHLHVVDLGRQQEGLLQSDAFGVVVADYFRTRVVGQELLVAYSKQLGVQALRLDGF